MPSIDCDKKTPCYANNNMPIHTHSHLSSSKSFHTIYTSTRSSVSRGT